MSEEEHRVIACMQRYGGSFVKALAAAYAFADEQNRLTIRTAFAGYWERYRSMAGALSEENKQ
jgi:hypothetical protein